MIITVNGEPREVPEDKRDEKLLPWLREELALRGTKNGCGIGACGACTVLVDGRPRRACVTTVAKAEGKSVLTIEGLEGADGSLHPIQQSFMDAGAIQCGFCTPGMVLATYALLESNPDPTREEIAKALRGNLCRCTGYFQIIEAVQSAASRLRG